MFSTFTTTAPHPNAGFYPVEVTPHGVNIIGPHFAVDHRSAVQVARLFANANGLRYIGRES